MNITAAAGLIHEGRIIKAREFSTKKRKQLAKSGAAMPGGRYPIENTTDLANAKKDYYRTGKSPSVKRHIQKRAKALGVGDPFKDEGEAGEE